MTAAKAHKPPVTPIPDLFAIVTKFLRRNATRLHYEPARGMDDITGRVAEWFKAAVLKTAVGESPPWVRIPPLPPCKLSAEFEFFNAHMQAVDLIGFLSISS